MSATLKLPIYITEFLKAEDFCGAVCFSMVTYKGLEKPLPPSKSTESHSPQKYWMFFSPEALNYPSSLTFPVLIGRIRKRTNEVSSLPFLSLVCGSPRPRIIWNCHSLWPVGGVCRHHTCSPSFQDVSLFWSLLPFSLPCSCSLPSSKSTSLAELSYPQLLTLRKKADKLPANPDSVTSDCWIKSTLTGYLARLSQRASYSIRTWTPLSFALPQELHPQTFSYQDRLWSCLRHNTVSCHLLPWHRSALVHFVFLPKISATSPNVNSFVCRLWLKPSSPSPPLPQHFSFKLSGNLLFLPF